MGKIKVAINGFGRIGRVFTRCIAKDDNIELIAINDLVDAQTLSYLLKYDSIHGINNAEISCDQDSISINSKKVKVFSERDPSNLPWGDLGVDVVIESTGFFRTKEGASKHLSAGAKKVIISAPASSADIKTIVMGVNDHILNGDETILSNASCTTNCAAPMIKVIEDLCKIKSGYITTTHAYTGDQNIHDAPHKDLRRARAAARSIIPTSTGAAKAIGKIFPNLNGKLEGIGIRVPVINGSLTDIICVVENSISKDDLNNALFNASKGEMNNVLSYTEEPIVSNDIVGNPYSCIIDSGLTTVKDNTVRVIGWYDNEFGYSNRLVDLVKKIC
jgi:glyceraldehyde 3-phosphate dehydrogenase